MSDVRILPMGDRALLAEVDSLDLVAALHAALADSPPPGVIDLVPAARTVLVRVDPALLALSAARAWIDRVDLSASHPRAERRVDLAIDYDGQDLADTAELLGLTPGTLIARHSSARWTVAFTGFAPGFGYLVSPDWSFDVPRLATPRTRVPAGAVGLAAGFTGAYPRETPGGWRLVGTTDAILFDPDAAMPALLAPGTSVRMVPGTGRPRPPLAPPVAGSRRAPAGIRIVEPGLLATMQDLGRAGSAALGVAPSGAFDRAAFRTANRLVGNPESAAAIEVTMGGFRAVAERDLWVAITGGWGRITVDGCEIDPYEAHLWPAGAELHLDWFARGARAYLGVRGGVEAHAVLGSESTDTLAGIGPERLASGDVVRVAPTPREAIPVSALAPWGAPRDDTLDLDLAPGPRADWFTDQAHRELFETVWTVSNDADRVGVRLDGPELERSRVGELPSEGMVPGALQVPPSGRPTVLGADGPVTGGYPVIAVLADAGIDVLAQARPGTRIRFRHARATA